VEVSNTALSASTAVESHKQHHAAFTVTNKALLALLALTNEWLSRQRVVDPWQLDF
jgi:hypothetical protein